LGSILVGTPGDLRKLELTETTIIGRHWQCNVVLNSPHIPLYWLEIRWINGNWAWRSLGATERTKGTGTAGRHGWMYWHPRTGTKMRVNIENGSRVELLDVSPPGLLLQDLFTGEQFPIPACFDYLALSNRHVYRRGQDEEDPSVAIVDGEVFEMDGKPLRLWLPVTWEATVEPLIDITHPNTEMAINPGTLTACFVNADSEIRLKGEYVRLLGVYLRARKEGSWDADGGWLSSEEAHAAWIQSGGLTSSPIERIAWMRGKARSHLIQNGAGKSETLFDRRRKNSHWEHRISLAPSQLHIDENQGPLRPRG